jgi:aryl-alcohol dehydrogenase-like predicted oxidoreductase
VRFALAQPGVCVAVPGADSVAHLDEARAALALPLPDEAAQKALVERLGPHRGRESEWYKDE